MRTRFARVVRSGIVLELRWFNSNGCRQHVASSGLIDEESRDADDYEEWRWSTTCDACQDGAPPSASKHVATAIEYNTPSGKLEPGCFYWASQFPPDYFWDNQHGMHLGVVAPNGFRWIIDSPAVNCQNSDNRFHRCWAWRGDPEIPTVTVYHDDTTCGRGDPALVQLGTWSGYLVDGQFLTQLPSVVYTSGLVS